jgi:hypothetical protein
LPALRWPEHPNVVRLYAAGDTEGVAYMALQLVNGSTLERLTADRRVGRRTMRNVLTEVGTALDAAHAAGQVHGAVAARNVFVERGGRALLSDFGLGDEGASPATDRAAFADLIRACGGRVSAGATPSTAREIAGPAFPGRRRWMVPAALGALAAIAAATAAVAWLSSGGSTENVPPVLDSAVALGSKLPSGGVESVDCANETPSGASEACTVAQTTLAGRTVSPKRAGVARRWTVRGAHGQLALEVLRRHGRRFFMVARTPYADIQDEGVHVLPANLPVRPGDLVGLAVTPGAAVGIRHAEGRTARWFGPLIYTVRAPEKGPGSGFDHELLLRVEYVPGASWQRSGRLVGDAAASAPPGRVAGRYVLRRGAEPASLVVTRVGGGVAADLVVGGRRLVRLPVESARREGELQAIEYEAARFGRQILRVRWQNPHSSVVHDYVVGERSLALLS